MSDNNEELLDDHLRELIDAVHNSVLCDRGERDDVVQEARMTIVNHVSALLVERDSLRAALTELYAVVQGECPALLNDEGSYRTQELIDKALSYGPDLSQYANGIKSTIQRRKVP